MRLRQVKRTKKRIDFSVLQDDEQIGEALVEQTKGGWLWFVTYWDPSAKKEIPKEGASPEFEMALRALKSAVAAGWDADSDIIAIVESPASRKPASRKPASRKPASRKPASRKPASRKPALRKPACRRCPTCGKI